MKVKASGMGKTFWRKEKVQEPPWGERGRWKPALKILLCDIHSRKSECRASGTSKWSLRPQDGTLCF